jgi:hypothetical protein
VLPARHFDAPMMQLFQEREAKHQGEKPQLGNRQRNQALIGLDKRSDGIAI